MDINIYRILHVVGLILVFTSFGALLLGPRDDSKIKRKMAMIFHGIGVLVMLVAGFGMMARLEIAFPWFGWLWAKLGCWLVISLLPVAVSKGWVPRSAALFLAIALAAFAVYCVHYKPFA